jgi:hypothetical protein
VTATLQRLAGKIRLPEGAQVKLVNAKGEELASVLVPERARKQKKGDKTAAADAASAEAAAKARAEAEAGVEAGLELSNDDAFVDGNTLHLGTEVLRILRQVPVRCTLGGCVRRSFVYMFFGEGNRCLRGSGLSESCRQRKEGRHWVDVAIGVAFPAFSDHHTYHSHTCVVAHRTPRSCWIYTFLAFRL